VIDGFELDEITKEKTSYSNIIEIIDNFPSFLKAMQLLLITL
jgi:hypothetical protein